MAIRSSEISEWKGALPPRSPFMSLGPENVTKEKAASQERRGFA